MDGPLVFSGDLPASTISSRVARGDLIRVASGVYVEKGHDVATAVRSHWHTIAGRLFPGAVITDRSAPSGAPVGGVLYLARGTRPRELKLPGLTIRARKGAPAQSDDIPLPHGLHLASPARGLAENCLESRSRAGAVPRTLSEEEMGDWVDRLCRNDGESRLMAYRQRAEELADTLGVPHERLALARDLVGMVVGTMDARPVVMPWSPAGPGTLSTPDAWPGSRTSPRRSIPQPRRTGRLRTRRSQPSSRSPRPTSPTSSRAPRVRLRRGREDCVRQRDPGRAAEGRPRHHRHLPAAC